MSDKNENLKKKSKDSPLNTIVTTLVLCLVCSLCVSLTAVGLKKKQDFNKSLDKKKNILLTAGLMKKDVVYTVNQIEHLYKKIKPIVIDFSTGKEVTNVDANNFDQRKATKDPKQSKTLSAREDIAKLNRRANYGIVYEVHLTTNKVDSLVIPISGYGLWSTLYGFLSVSRNAFVKEINFYEHAETPGLGGEIDNPKWKALWRGKRIYKKIQEGELILRVVKNGKVKNKSYEVDGMSGATITTVGVDNMIQFWLAPENYGTYLQDFLKKNKPSCGCKN